MSLPDNPMMRIAIGYAPNGMAEIDMYDLWKSGNPWYNDLRARDREILDAHNPALESTDAEED